MSSQAFVVVVQKATGLHNADGLMGTSDPYAKISSPTAPAILNTHTQTVQDSLNPVWDEALLVAIPTTVPAMIKIDVFDSDAGTLVDGTDEFLGSATFDLASCTNAPDAWTTLTLPLIGDKAKGTVTVLARPYCDLSVTIVSGTKLRNADGFFGTSDPFVRLTGLIGESFIWAATKTQRDTLSPTWNETFTVNLLAKMPMGGKLSRFVLECWDEDDKSQNSSDCDRLGSTAVPWAVLWAVGTAVLPLAGAGAKGGSSLAIKVAFLSNSGDAAGGLGGAGRALLAAAISSGGGVAAAEGEPTKVPKSACKAILGKSTGFKIADCTDKVEDRFTMGLSWDVTNGRSIDLDASCVWLDANLNVVDTVWYDQLLSRDGSMQHHGDEREGDEEGDDESISFDLEKVSSRAVYLCFCINSFTGQELNDVKDAKCRLYNKSTMHELATFDLSSDRRLDCTALLMCVLYRASAQGTGSTDWFMHAIGEPAMGRTVKDNVDEFQRWLDSTPLVALQASRPPEFKTANIKVPASAAGGGTIGFKTSAGGRQEVTLPPQSKTGDVVEIPLVDIYVA